MRSKCTNHRCKGATAAEDTDCLAEGLTSKRCIRCMQLLPFLHAVAEQLPFLHAVAVSAAQLSLAVLAPDSLVSLTIVNISVLDGIIKQTLCCCFTFSATPCNVACYMFTALCKTNLTSSA